MRNATPFNVYSTRESLKSPITSGSSPNERCFWCFSILWVLTMPFGWWLIVFSGTLLSSSGLFHCACILTRGVVCLISNFYLCNLNLFVICLVHVVELVWFEKLWVSPEILKRFWGWPVKFCWILFHVRSMFWCWKCLFGDDLGNAIILLLAF